MNLQEFKQMNNIVVHSAINGWRMLIYKFFDELKENEEVVFLNKSTIAFESSDCIYYPKKLIRNENYRMALLCDIEYTKEAEMDEDVILEISEFSLMELYGFSKYIMDYLNDKEKSEDF